MTSMATSIVTIPFLGERPYLQGPSILESVLERLPAGVNFVFKVKSRFSMNIVEIAPEPDSMKKPLAQLTWRSGSSGCENNLYFYPGPALSPELRIPFNERNITDSAELSGDSIRLKSLCGFGFPTVVVALKKFLLQTVWPMEGSGRWVFLAMEVNCYTVVFSEIEVELVCKVPAAKLARSVIRVGGVNVGSVDFVWK